MPHIRAVVFSPQYSTSILYIMIEDALIPNKVWVYSFFENRFVYVRENGKWFYVENGFHIKIEHSSAKNFNSIWEKMCQINI